MNETREPRRTAGTRADPEAAFGAAEAAALPQVQPRAPAPGAEDRTSAGAVVATTLVARLVVSGVLEYAGWASSARSRCSCGPPPSSPSSRW